MKMRNFWYSAAVALLTLTLSALPSARAAVVVTLPESGDYVAWVNGAKGEVLAGPAEVKDKKAILDTGTAKNTGAWSVLVADSASGNTAVAKVPSGESPRVELKADSFNRIGRVVVAVTDKEGKTPTFAAVTLTDGKGEDHVVALRPADAGRAVFHDVGAGDGSVRVQQGEAENQQTVTVRLPLDREGPELDLKADVALPDGMKTQDAAATPASDGAGKTEAAKPDASRGLSQLIGFLIALVVLGAAGYFALRVMRSQGVTARSALERAGIQLPDEDTPAAPSAAAEAPQMVDPNVCPFCGGQKDATGACPKCAVGASGAGMTGDAGMVTYAPSGGGRRIVALSGPRAGHSYPVDGTLTIGRETGQDVAVVEDPSLSRHHAVIEVAAGETVIADQGSSNGTWVNGQRVNRQVLRPGDEIALGASRFRYEE